MRLTTRAHDRLAQVIRPGDIAFDGTAGRGHDTQFLARAVGPEGKVFAIDLQAEAIAASQARLDKEGLQDRVWLRQGSHADLDLHWKDFLSTLPERQTRLRATMFNLGYLPQNSQAITTEAESTLRALSSARALMLDGGVMTVLCYRGHEKGPEEFEAVRGYMEARGAKGDHIERHNVPTPTSGNSPRDDTPVLFILESRSEAEAQ